jgi:cytoskeleton protein RodZ
MTIDTEAGENGRHKSPNSVGALLREARESLNLDLPDAAGGLRIRLVYLQGIESDNYAQLPGKTYVLGFLRSYAEFLGLDGDDVVARYRRQLDDRELPAPSLNFPLREAEARLPRGAVLLLSLVLAGGAVYGGARWLGEESLKSVDRVSPVPERLIGDTRPAPAPSFTPRNDPSSAFAAVTPQPTESGSSASVLSQPTPQPTPVAPPAAAPTPASSEPVSTGIAPAIEPPPGPQIATADPVGRLPAVPPPKPAKPEAARSEPAKPTPQQQTQALNQAQQAQPAQAPQGQQVAALPPAPAKPREIVVVARVDSWIEVRDGNNRPLASLLLRVGDSYRVPEGANYRLVTGDVRGLEVRVDGVAVRQRGTDDNKPHRILSLDADRLHGGTAVAD